MQFWRLSRVEFFDEASGDGYCLRDHEGIIRHHELPRRLLRRQSYFNNPPDYLTNMNDEWQLNRLRHIKIVLGTADWDMCLDANVKMAGIFQGKRIPHWLDIFADNSKHDWPLWQRMAGKYF